MPRRGHVGRRPVHEDPIYQDKLVTKLINKIMYDGKKALPKRYAIVLLTLWHRRPARTPWKFSRKP